MRPRRWHTGALGTVHCRERIAHTMQQKLPQRRPGDCAAARFAQARVLKTRDGTVNSARAGHERFCQRLVTLLRDQEKAERDGDIEGTQGRLRRHRRRFREDGGGGISESVTAPAATPLLQHHLPTIWLV